MTIKPNHKCYKCSLDLSSSGFVNASHGPGSSPADCTTHRKQLYIFNPSYFILNYFLFQQLNTSSIHHIRELEILHGMAWHG